MGSLPHTERVAHQNGHNQVAKAMAKLVKTCPRVRFIKIEDTKSYRSAPPSGCPNDPECHSVIIIKSTSDQGGGEQIISVSVKAPAEPAAPVEPAATPAATWWAEGSSVAVQAVDTDGLVGTSGGASIDDQSPPNLNLAALSMAADQHATNLLPDPDEARLGLVQASLAATLKEIIETKQGAPLVTEDSTAIGMDMSGPDASAADATLVVDVSAEEAPAEEIDLQAPLVHVPICAAVYTPLKRLVAGSTASSENSEPAELSDWDKLALIAATGASIAESDGSTDPMDAVAGTMTNALQSVCARVAEAAKALQNRHMNDEFYFRDDVTTDTQPDAAPEQQVAAPSYTVGCQEVLFAMAQDSALAQKLGLPIATLSLVRSLDQLAVADAVVPRYLAPHVNRLRNCIAPLIIQALLRARAAGLSSEHIVSKGQGLLATPAPSDRTLLNASLLTRQPEGSFVLFLLTNNVTVAGLVMPLLGDADVERVASALGSASSAPCRGVFCAVPRTSWFNSALRPVWSCSAPKEPVASYLEPKVLKQVHPDTHITEHALAVVADIGTIVLQRLVTAALRVAAARGSNVGKGIEVTTALMLAAGPYVLPGELTKHGMSEAMKAIKKAKKDEMPLGDKAKCQETMLAAAAAHVADCTPEEGGVTRVSTGAVVVGMALVEYVVAEILELAGNRARDDRMQFITPRHLKMAITTDEELAMMFAGVTWGNAGVTQHLPISILPDAGLGSQADISGVNGVAAMLIQNGAASLDESSHAALNAAAFAAKAESLHLAGVSVKGIAGLKKFALAECIDLVNHDIELESDSDSDKSDGDGGPLTPDDAVKHSLSLRAAREALVAGIGAAVRVIRPTLAAEQLMPVPPAEGSEDDPAGATPYTLPVPEDGDGWDDWDPSTGPTAHDSSIHVPPMNESASERGATSEALVDRIGKFYTERAPDDLARVDPAAIAVKYAGRENVLFAKLNAKYPESAANRPQLLLAPTAPTPPPQLQQCSRSYTEAHAGRPAAPLSELEDDPTIGYLPGSTAIHKRYPPFHAALRIPPDGGSPHQYLERAEWIAQATSTPTLSAGLSPTMLWRLARRGGVAFLDVPTALHAADAALCHWLDETLALPISKAASAVQGISPGTLHTVPTPDILEAIPTVVLGLRAEVPEGYFDVYGHCKESGDDPAPAQSSAGYLSELFQYQCSSQNEHEDAKEDGDHDLAYSPSWAETSPPTLKIDELIRTTRAELADGSSDDAAAQSAAGSVGLDCFARREGLRAIHAAQRSVGFVLPKRWFQNAVMAATERASGVDSTSIWIPRLAVTGLQVAAEPFLFSVLKAAQHQAVDKHQRRLVVGGDIDGVLRKWATPAGARSCASCVTIPTLTTGAGEAFAATHGGGITLKPNEDGYDRVLWSRPEEDDSLPSEALLVQHTLAHGPSRTSTGIAALTSTATPVSDPAGESLATACVNTLSGIVGAGHRPHFCTNPVTTALMAATHLQTELKKTLPETDIGRCWRGSMHGVDGVPCRARRRTAGGVRCCC